MGISNILPRPHEQGFIARDWKPYQKNSLQGFISIELPSGLIVREITVHEKDGTRWLGMPSKSYQKQDGTTGWTPQVDFKDAQARSRFTREALKAIDKLLQESA
jgi:DNA-binding cell septation regulator SpoVG